MSKYSTFKTVRVPMMTRDRGGVVSHEKVDLLQLAAIAAAAIIQKRRRMLGEGGREGSRGFLSLSPSAVTLEEL